MDKYLKLFLYVIAIVLIYFGISTVMKSCSGNKTSDPDATSISAGSEEDLFEDSDDESFESNQTDGDEIPYEEIDKALDEKDRKASDSNLSNSTSQTDNDDSFEMSEEEKASVQTSNPSSPTKKPNNTKPSNPGNNTGSYLIITGSYLVKANAENMVRQLEGLGYSNAEIVVFDNSQYNSVVAARYRDYGSAVDASSSLKRRGVDCYVHRKK